ncbi:MAG TPA: hypothetical protein VHB54_16200 [Mucilaginibacter sp.]|nr:hypothetical protein [Mucilaginibacter sp.]
MQKLNLLTFYIYFGLASPAAFAQSTQAQKTPVPFRVGNKFGLADEAGKFIIQPQFDWVEINDTRNHVLTGFTIKDGITLTSLIYKNKLLLLNQNYGDYYLRNSLFIAVKYKPADENNPEFKKRFTQKEDLFTTDGKKLTDGSDTYINILNDIDEDQALDQTLVMVSDTAQRQSVFVYDHKLKRITKKFIVNTDYLRITNNAERYYKDKSYTMVFKNEQGVVHEIKIVNNGKTLVLAYDKIGSIKPDQHYEGVRTLNIPFRIKRFKADSNVIHDSVSGVANKYEIFMPFYYVPKSYERLQNTVARLNGDVLVTKNGKRGLNDENTGDIIIPALYDDIIEGEAEGGGAVYVLRLGKTYQAVYYNLKPVIIPTVFNKIPFAIADYLGKGHPLIKLYDENGLFFCYANSDGKLYYREK